MQSFVTSKIIKVASFNLGHPVYSRFMITCVVKSNVSVSCQLLRKCRSCIAAICKISFADFSIYIVLFFKIMSNSILQQQICRCYDYDYTFML